MSDFIDERLDSALLSDLKAFFSRYFVQESHREISCTAHVAGFASFKEQWKTECMVRILYALPIGVPQQRLMSAIFSICWAFLTEFQQPFVVRAAALYAVYITFKTQQLVDRISTPTRPRITPNVWNSLLELLKDARKDGIKDVLLIFNTLKKEHAFIFSLSEPAFSLSDTFSATPISLDTANNNNNMNSTGSSVPWQRGINAEDFGQRNGPFCIEIDKIRTDLEAYQTAKKNVLSATTAIATSTGIPVDEMTNRSLHCSAGDLANNLEAEQIAFREEREKILSTTLSQQQQTRTSTPTNSNGIAIGFQTVRTISSLSTTTPTHPNSTTPQNDDYENDDDEMVEASAAAEIEIDSNEEDGDDDDDDDDDELPELFSSF